MQAERVAREARVAQAERVDRKEYTRLALAERKELSVVHTERRLQVAQAERARRKKAEFPFAYKHRLYGWITPPIDGAQSLAPRH